MMPHKIQNWIPFKACEYCGAEAGEPCWNVRLKNKKLLFSGSAHGGRKRGVGYVYASEQCPNWNKICEELHGLETWKKIKKLKAYFFTINECCDYRTRYSQVLVYLTSMSHESFIVALNSAQRDDLKTAFEEIRIKR